MTYQDSILIHSYPGYAKADKPRENEAKIRRSRRRTWIKKVDESNFGSKFHIIIARLYEIIGRLKITTSSRHDSKVNLLEKRKLLQSQRILWSKIKRLLCNNEKTSKEHIMEIKDISRNKRIA